jgi:energy-converting hydrogenase Eha subunit H
MSFEFVKQVATSITSVGVLLGGLWTVGDRTGYRWATKIELVQLTDQVNSVSQEVKIGRYLALKLKIEAGTNTVDELVEFCLIVVALGITNIHCR